MKPLRGIVCFLLVVASLHSAGQALFRGSVGGIGLLFANAMTRTEEQKAKSSDEIDRKWDKGVEEAKGTLAIELAAGIAFGLLCIFEFAAAILSGLGHKSKLTVFTCALALALVGWRISRLPSEAAKTAASAPPTDSHEVDAAKPAWYGPSTDGDPMHYLPSALHIGGAVLGLVLWFELARRRKAQDQAWAVA